MKTGFPAFDKRHLFGEYTTHPSVRPTAVSRIIEHCYREFLLQNHDEREYPDADDQICEVLNHGNYLSKKDIKICRSFDLTTL